MNSHTVTVIINWNNVLLWRVQFYGNLGRQWNKPVLLRNRLVHRFGGLYDNSRIGTTSDLRQIWEKDRPELQAQPRGAGDTDYDSGDPDERSDGPCHPTRHHHWDPRPVRVPRGGAL